MTNHLRRCHAKAEVDRVRVGIQLTTEVRVRFSGEYVCNIYRADEVIEKSTVASKECAITVADLKDGDRVEFMPKDEKTCYFELQNVEIGTDFHWQEQHTLSYRGILVIQAKGEGKVQVINDLDIEEYIRSVIGSEMAPTCPLELLKAHAIISRTWLVSQLQRKARSQHPIYKKAKLKICDDEMIQIWDVMGHSDFDVCSDDHCQRYQGLNPDNNVDEAINETAGMILKSGGEVCDARFSKCCGGISEKFSTCWTDEDYAYLSPVRCNVDRANDINYTGDAMSLKEWVRNPPTDVYCATKDYAILSRVLKAYDQRTTEDMFRWSVKYTREELTQLIKEKIGVDVGKVVDLRPVQMGKSGRISRLDIIGTL
ncbi:MAG: SpoIID/LytB domain-containing protein, partial [Paludibacteraceae bacterium]|nr:SpoIID/LytB domain-containing protein [Paludibacteraceae bacterium]